jgi:hypothetical protein
MYFYFISCYIFFTEEAEFYRNKKNKDDFEEGSDY